MDNIEYRNNQRVTLVARFNQSAHIHANLNEHFFTGPSVENIRMAAGLESINDLLTNSIRVASFEVDITDPGQPVYIIDRIPTLEIFSMIPINLDNGRDVSKILAEKAIHDINKLHLPQGRYLISFDIYYDRAIETAGLFHRDIHVGPGNNPAYVSLEYFTDNNLIFLGPEAVPYEAIPDVEIPVDFPVLDIEGINVIHPDIVRVAAAQARAAIPFHQSMRLLVTNGSVLAFNNHLLIHATPITAIGQGASIDEQTPFVNTGFHRRAEIDDRYIQLRVNTQQRRSFIRSWISLAPADYEPTLLERFVFSGFSFPGSFLDPVPRRVTMNDIYGGGSEKPNHLVSFQIIGNLLNPGILIKKYTSFDPIKPKDVKKYIDIENRLLLGIRKRRPVLQKKIKTSKKYPLRQILSNAYTSNKMIQGGRKNTKRKHPKKK